MRTLPRCGRGGGTEGRRSSRVGAERRRSRKGRQPEGGDRPRRPLIPPVGRVPVEGAVGRGGRDGTAPVRRSGAGRGPAGPTPAGGALPPALGRGSARQLRAQRYPYRYRPGPRAMGRRWGSPALQRFPVLVLLLLLQVRGCRAGRRGQEGTEGDGADASLGQVYGRRCDEAAPCQPGFAAETFSFSVPQDSVAAGRELGRGRTPWGGRGCGYGAVPHSVGWSCGHGDGLGVRHQR